MSMNKTNKNHKTKGARAYIAKVIIGTFFVAALLSVSSNLLLQGGGPPFWSILLLLVVIFVGVLFDIIGVAVTAAGEAPFHAKATRRIAGAKQALALLRKADRVANICNDVVGDICGTVSGGLGTAIAIVFFGSGNVWGGVVITGLVSAFTVGGKAMGKSFAIKKSNEIVWQVARILAFREILQQNNNYNGCNGNNGNNGNNDINGNKGNENGKDL